MHNRGYTHMRKYTRGMVVTVEITLKTVENDWFQRENYTVYRHTRASV